MYSDLFVVVSLYVMITISKQSAHRQFIQGNHFGVTHKMQPTDFESSDADMDSLVKTPSLRNSWRTRVLSLSDRLLVPS